MQRLKILALMVGLVNLGLTGCSASNCDVEVYLDPELQTAYGQIPTLEVDIAGVNASQAQRLQNMNLDAYFTPNSPQRRALAPLTLHFSQEQPGPMFLADDDEIWARWEERGAQFIAVICNLPQFLSLSEPSESAQASPQASQAPSQLAGPMAEMANENSAVFNDGRVLLINMHDGFLKDSSEHLVQISVDGLLTLKERPAAYLQNAPQEKQPDIRTVQDLKRLEQQRLDQQLEQNLSPNAPNDGAAAAAGMDAPHGVNLSAAQMEQMNSNAAVNLGNFGLAEGQTSKVSLGLPMETGASSSMESMEQVLADPNVGKVSFPNLGK